MSDGQTFREIIPIEVDGKRILMFKIPASPRNIVMKWKGIAFGRDGESMKPLNQSKQDEIRNQTPIKIGLPKLIVPNASLDDLDEVAISKARKMFKKVHSKSFSEYLLMPAVVQETWTLRDEKQDVVDYEHFSQCHSERTSD